MKILLVYPKHPETFWSFKHALKFISKKSTLPPLGLLTIAAMLPKDWEIKLVDLNTAPLVDKDLHWADYVWMSAISIQTTSVRDILSRCQKIGVKTVAGGPLFSSTPAEFKAIDHLILNEAEITLPAFIRDLQQGRPQAIYSSSQKADLATTPLPRWDLIRFKQYASMSIQYSRGCPFDCEFCDITALYGRKTRTKEQTQVLRELDHLYSQGWRGNVFFVDDNFIGNKSQLKNSLLPAIAEWMTRKHHPFVFNTQVSINLADDEVLIKKMIQAGFSTVFIGIESPNAESLNECMKIQNQNRDLIASVKKCQNLGLQVQGGFIMGFDNDPPSIFEHHIKFIQKSGIVSAMVGLLNALPGTKLYQRLKKENRLLQHTTGDNMDCSINFTPKMNYETLISGYKQVISKIYSPAYYYKRVINFLKEYQPTHLRRLQIRLSSFIALGKSIWWLGILGKERLHYWKLFFWSLFRRPSLFPLAIAFAIYGFHYRKVFEKYA